jgi:hypothetical protein
MKRAPYDPRRRPRKTDATTLLRQEVRRLGLNCDLTPAAYGADGKATTYNLVSRKDGRIVAHNITSAEHLGDLAAAGRRLLVQLANRLHVTPEELAEAHLDGRLELKAIRR